MGYPRWKVYDHREIHNKTIFIGLNHRCENHLIDVTSTQNRIYSVCDQNKYDFHCNKQCNNIHNVTNDNEKHRLCNLPNNPCNCDYSSITKGLMSCTIIAAITLSIALLLISSHILLNQYKYKIHFYISAITIVLLVFGLIFILITLILHGSTMSYDLYQYVYGLDCKLDTLKSQEEKDNYKMNITQEINRHYIIRHDWATGLEIIALILSSFTLLTQIIYIFSIHRNQIG
ncbi:unnamed protein product [Adineta steineri]|uniref:Uncharacterized protein n=1 Tax=Adineta steineri TaxID=433720 RepID=A0A818UNC1_9BILA|nr:unnamed protein product [Adineta steineri]